MGAHNGLQEQQTALLRGGEGTAIQIDVSGSGDTELVAAVAGRKIRVLAMNLTAADAVNVKFKSASTEIHGPIICDAAGAGLVRNGHAFICETAAGEALKINLSGAVQVGGGLTYVLI